MGCDIHPFIEIKKGDKWEICDFFIGGLYKDHYHNDKGFLITSGACLIGERHYALFALLAGVRADDNNFIYSEPRGIPDDSCYTIREYFGKIKNEYVGLHSESFYTVMELRNIPWDDATEVYNKDDKFDKTTIKYRFHTLFNLMQVLGTICKIDDIPEDNCRLVFGFDN